MVEQYPDILKYSIASEGGQDEWGVPIETIEEFELVGRYENYQSNTHNQFTDKSGVTIFANGKYLAKFGQELPKRFITAEVRGMTFEILSVHKGQLNYTIYLKEVK